MMIWKRDFRAVLIGAGIVCLTAAPVVAQTFDSGSTGADGPFNPTADTTLTLPPSGVFNFTTVNIPSGVTVTFTRNAANTPVTILATGDVTITGTIDVSGQAAGALGIPGRGGPGGFDGGMGGNPTVALLGTAGLGPGGGGGGDNIIGATGGGAGFATAGGGKLGGPTYGTPTLLPLIGGSGGGGGVGLGTSVVGGGGGGGGGAVLIASSATINVAGVIKTNGGDGASVSSLSGGGGSGGGIRLIASRIEGSGSVQAGLGSGAFGSNGGFGRVRLEAFDIAFTGGSVPAPSVGTPGPVIPPAGSPTLQITMVAGVAPPASPQGSFLAPSDITLSPTLTNPVTVDLAAANIPLGTNVAVTVTPEGGSQTSVLSTALSGTQPSSTASATVTLPNGTSIISATATFATSTASLGTPMMIGGEEVKWIRVGATYGGSSTVTYITTLGKEVRIR